MASARLNPYRTPKAFSRVRLGGRLITAVLKTIGNCTIKDNWKMQRSRETGGAVMVFTGTDPVGGEGGFKLTFRAPREDMFDDLRETLDLIKPVAGLSSTSSTPSPKGGQQYGIGSPAAADSSGSSSSSGGDFKIPGNNTTATANPGPRPPTLPIENAILNDWMGVFAVARGEMEAPVPTPDNAWEWTVGFIHDKPPHAAGTGTMGPPKTTGSQYAIGSAGADGAQGKADAGAAGT